MHNNGTQAGIGGISSVLRPRQCAHACLQSLSAIMQAQGAMQQLQPLLRAFTTSSAACAAPALAAPKTGGLLSSIFGGSRIDVPLNEPLPSVAEPPRSGVMKSAPVLQTTALSAGTKLATLDSASPVSALGLFVQGGSSFETAATVGASKVLEAVAFKSTANRSTFRLTRELEKLGASVSCVAGREHIAFSIDFVKLNSREAVEMLVDSVVNARYAYWEVRDSLDVVKEQLAEAVRNPSTVLSEVLHRAAFDGGLSNSLIVDPSQVGARVMHRPCAHRMHFACPHAFFQCPCVAFAWALQSIQRCEQEALQ